MPAWQQERDRLRVVQATAAATIVVPGAASGRQHQRHRVWNRPPEAWTYNWLDELGEMGGAQGVRDGGQLAEDTGPMMTEGAATRA